ncbi:MAG: asparagine synthase (glutamine-hydrolyzing) [Holosporales bacterium]|jgi:asparagine synthase (glutamine-hydrolysing)|nr:asparagine synthase (glutamine-hydrolyzing) [Holosporales bacterium]
MCGIAGLIDDTHKLSSATLAHTIDKMTDVLSHRGPDSRGTWVSAEQGAALGHRRLAIRDLSAAGHQPMVSASGRYVIVYNGEVYSHKEIAEDLMKYGYSFRGNSDTEVILEACAVWGVEKTLDRLVGMFAFALFDKQDRVLWCARDRLGIKPLYWGMLDGVFAFGSELKALRAYHGWHPTLDRDSVASFMRFNYIPAPRTIYKGVHKLEPGYYLQLHLGEDPVVRPFWQAQNVVLQGLQDRKKCCDEKALLEELESLLKEAVKCRMVADVPIGAFLSGGIDSSLVTALMVEQSDVPVRTFSIGFSDQEYNEAPYAAAVAQHLGTHHTELYADDKDALLLVEELPQWYDEPFADSSQIPTMLVSALTRKHVTVALSGDGGDELFAGYNRYRWAQQCHALSKIPCTALFAKMLRSNICAKVCQMGAYLFPRYVPSQLGHKLCTLAAVIELSGEESIYTSIISHWKHPNSLVLNASELHNVLWDASLKQKIPDFCDRMQFLDLITYLPDDILTKVDRSSMRVALEARVPLLDHRIVEFSWRLPQRMKIRHGITKWALCEVLYKRVPRSLIERPKMGFAAPIHTWLRGPLRAWAEDLIDEELLRGQGVFDLHAVRALWHKHLEGTNEGYCLWDILAFQSWLRANPEVSL